MLTLQNNFWRDEAMRVLNTKYPPLPSNFPELLQNFLYDLNKDIPETTIYDCANDENFDMEAIGELHEG